MIASASAFLLVYPFKHKSSQLHEASCFSCFHPFDLLRIQALFKPFLVCYTVTFKFPEIYSMSSASRTTAASFKSLLDTAFAKYKKKTGNDLLTYWLAAELNACESVDSLLDILRNQAKAFERPGDHQRLMRSIVLHQ